MSPNQAQKLFMSIHCESTVLQLVDDSEWHALTAAQLCDFFMNIYIESQCNFNFKLPRASFSVIKHNEILTSMQ